MERGTLSFWDRLKGIALDLLFPQRCLGCGREGHLLCPNCLKSLAPFGGFLCLHCGKPLPQGKGCSSCRAQPLAGYGAPFRFEGLMKEAIYAFKYKNLKSLAHPFGRLLADYLGTSPLAVEALVPVPLHPSKLRERGYNQSSLLAQELSKLTGLPVVEGCLLRRRATPPQARSSSLEARHRNVEEAFFCSDGRLQGKQVLLLDDVCTSGATLNSCALALRAGGSGSVWGLTLAREI